MHLPKLIFASFLVALLCLSLAAPLANAKLIEHTNLTEEAVQAEWEYTEGDIITFVSVTAFIYIVKTKPGDTTTEPLAVVSIFRWNLATADVLLSAVGVTSDMQFTVSNLETAQLSATVILEDGASATGFPVTVDLTWTGIGEIVKERSRFSEFQEGGFKFKSFFKGRSRDAIASGTVFGDPVVVPEENFTRGPSTEGAIMDNKFGILTIQTGGGQ